jgi:putative ABC transport system substrate-binding protein
MNRRDTVLALLALGVASGPRRVYSQQPGVKRRIGYLTAATSEFAKPFLPIIREQLRRVGYEEGRNLFIEWRFAEGRVDRLPELAENLVRQDIELIVASGNDPCIAAMRAKSTLPIVLFAGVVPVELGLVRSLSHPGGNVTGTTYNSPEMAGKTLEVLKDSVPGARRVALLWNPLYPGMRIYGAEVDRAASAFGVVMQYFDATRPEEIAGALQRIAASRPDSLYVANDPVVSSRMSEITAFALERKLPSIGTSEIFVAAGGLLYYGPDFPRIIERTMSYVDRILRGAKPADLPIEQPTYFELIVNTKTARALGLKIPQSILLRADRVIE